MKYLLIIAMFMCSCVDNNGKKNVQPEDDPAVTITDPVGNETEVDDYPVVLLPDGPCLADG